MADRSITGIDHSLVGVRDLEAARAAWQRLGFTLTPRGRHIGWGTANYCIMLDRGYVELLGIVDAAQFTNNLDKFLAEREGLLGLAFGSRDATATRRGLAAIGLHPDGPKDLQRALELPGGNALPAFSLVFLPPEETPGLRAFFVQHLTPEIIRHPAWVVHANRAVSLEAVIAVVDAPAALAPAYARLFGDSAVALAADTLRVATGEGVLLFVTPAELARLYPQLSLPAFPRPWVAAMRIGAPSVVDAADYFDAKGLRPLATGAGIALAPELATGTILEFVAAFAG
ncbi:MAG TPA: VOC family protein [Dongiaceae bacterium]|nr:VOC family protein [Dongiaceae bacterium]